MFIHRFKRPPGHTDATCVTHRCYKPPPPHPQDAAVTALGYDILYQLGYANQSRYWLPGHGAGALCALDMPCVGVHDLSVLAIWAVAGVLACFLLLRFCVRDPH